MTNLIISLLVLVCLTNSCGSKKTIADYTRAIELTPNDPIAYYDRGNAYYHSGDLEQDNLFHKIVNLLVYSASWISVAGHRLCRLVRHRQLF